MIAAAAYLCGSVPTGLWLGRAAGVDVRAAGSGNIGATNVARTVSRRLGLVTLVADVAKGAIPVAVARMAGISAAGLALVGLMAVLGHVFPVFARFRGGKGVATAAGAFLALAPTALAGACVVFAAVAGISGVVSLASLCAGASLPVLLVLLGDSGPRLWAAVATAALLFLTHRDNLRRIARGTEPRFSAKKR